MNFDKEKTKFETITEIKSDTCVGRDENLAFARAGLGAPLNR